VALLLEDEHVVAVGHDVLDPQAHERAQLLVGLARLGEQRLARARAAGPSAGRRSPAAAAPCRRSSGRGCRRPRPERLRRARAPRSGRSRARRTRARRRARPPRGGGRSARAWRAGSGACSRRRDYRKVIRNSNDHSYAAGVWTSTSPTTTS
jgi:hypothetical protein